MPNNQCILPMPHAGVCVRSNNKGLLTIKGEITPTGHLLGDGTSSERLATAHWSRILKPLAGKKVRVTIEELPQDDICYHVLAEINKASE